MANKPITQLQLHKPIYTIMRR